MTVNFPVSLDNFTNPVGTDEVGVVLHAEQHADENDAIEALEAKIGIDNSPVATSLDYLLKNTSSSNPGHKHTIVAITGTKAQFDTACTDGNFLYVGDITQYTDEMAQDATGAMVDSTLVYVDATPLLTRAALTGDITASQGSNATILATVNSNVGTFGSATKSVAATVNGKGLVTAISEQTVTPAVGSITGLGTGIATWLTTPSSANLLAAVTDETGTGALMFGTAPTVTTSLTMADAANFIFNTTTGTKIGTATTQKIGFYNSTPIVQPTGDIKTALSNLGLIGSPTVTADTNANLTGVITSVGNATSIASQTGTGTKFVVDTSPTFSTSIGVNTAPVANHIVEAGAALNGTSVGFKHTNTSNGANAFSSIQLQNDAGALFAFFLNSSTNTVYGGANTVTFDMASNFNMAFATNDTMRLTITNVGNLKLAGTALRATTEGTNHLDIFDGTAPVGTLANGISLYSTSGELRVMDAAGNATLLSPHDDDGNYIHDEINFKGRRLIIKMEAMLKAINNHFGWDFVQEYTEAAYG